MSKSLLNIMSVLLACNLRHSSHAGGQEQSVFLRWELNFFVMQILRKSFFIVLTTNMAALSRGCKRSIDYQRKVDVLCLDLFSN